ncbi:MAG: 50S ribosomal protein L17 [Chloroflexi bacterium]|nr:50S ribosomal protein L17 [Chloroflexota bacterium]
MRHQVSGRRFDRASGHRMMMYRTLVTDLLKHGYVRTTAAKAREVKPMAEKMVTLGKAGSLHARRQAAAFITEPAVVRSVFDDLAGRYKDRPGGYTRLIKLGPRKGDASEMALLQLV